MPTKILYLEAYSKPDDGLSFFGEYNPHAVCGSYVHSGRISNENSEMLFLSKPNVWAQYVVSGIEMVHADKKRRLRAVGQFLFDAQLFGFSLDSLAASHFEGMQQDYVSAEKLLREDERAVYISSEVANHILGMYSVQARVTIIPTGYGKKEKMVQNTPDGKRNFWSTVNRALETEEIKQYLAEASVLTAWANLRDGARPPLHKIVEAESNLPEEQYTLPSVSLFAHAAEIERKKMEEDRIRQIEAERQMSIQSNLGKIICGLIGEVPPKKKRQEILDRLEGLVDQYATVIQNTHDNALVIEFDEIVRRIEELGQGVNNVYTRELRGMFRPLEKLISV